MASNFDFLKRADGLYDVFADACLEAERVYAASPRMCAVACRRALELAIHWVYAADVAIHTPYKDNLASYIHERTFKDCLDANTWHKVVYVQRLGNVAAHEERAVRPQDANASLRGLFEFVDWIDYCYGPDYRTRTFDEAKVPASGVSLTREQVEQVISDHAVVEEQARRIAQLEAQLKDASDLLTQERERHQAERDFAPEDLSEFETRRRFIDLDLRLAGWALGPGGNVAEEYPVTGMPSPTGQGAIDYLLLGRDGRPLAVVEAKRTSFDPKKGLEQARLYCDCLQRRFGYRPPFFLTNGFDVLYGDEESAPRPVDGFFTQDELATIMGRRGRVLPFSTSLVSDQICGRYYQKAAIAATCEGFERGERKALLVMATGTGKTRTAIGLVDVLSRMGRAKNVLFLADRVALVNQAANAFKRHLPQVSRCNLCDKGKRNLSARVVLATYPSIMNAIDAARDGEGYRVLTPGHFDLVIVDEAHRSIFKKYRAIFRHFDALLVGLTATPAKEVDHNTYHFFDLPDGMPTYLYDYDTAVYQDRVLVPYVPIQTHTTFLDQGITYADLTDEEKERLDEDFDEAREDRPDYIPEDRINRWVFNEQTVDGVLQTLMGHGIRVDGGERLGKTIIFAASQKHARYIVERFGKLYPSLPPTYMKTVLNGDDYASQTIEDFEVPDRMPAIAVSVDMLDTGVDVPEVVNLVFFKKVRSKIKFWQMIGRGTRLCPGLGVVEPPLGGDPGGPREDKARFLIFDWCRNFEYFGQGGGEEEGGTPPTTSELVFARQAQLAFGLQTVEYAEDGYQDLRRGLVDALQGQVAGLNDELFVVRQHRQAVERFRDAGAFTCLSEGDLATLQRELAPLAHYDEQDVDALRFDALMYGFMCACCDGTEQAVRSYGARLDAVARALQRKATIPQVKQVLPLLEEIVADDFLDGATVLELERVRLALRHLVRFIDRDRHNPVFTDLADPVTRMEVGEVLHPAEDFQDYREKVTHYLKAHEDNLVVAKLRHNRPLTEMDYQDLGRILTQDLGSEEDYHRAFANQPFGLLVRQVAGLDHEAAMEAFSEFIGDESLNATQIDFVRRVVDYVERNGYMEPEALAQAPFDRPAPLFKLFDPGRCQRLVDALRRVKRNAELPAA